MDPEFIERATELLRKYRLRYRDDGTYDHHPCTEAEVATWNQIWALLPSDKLDLWCEINKRLYGVDLRAETKEIIRQAVQLPKATAPRGLTPEERMTLRKINQLLRPSPS